jgi:hypothetical protein
MPIDYAIGVGIFIPNNAVFVNEEALALMTREMEKRGIKHTTSECTLRGFTCSCIDCRRSSERLWKNSKTRIYQSTV